MEKLPVQIETLIKNLLDPSSPVHSRSNYRMRLQVVRDQIDDAIRKYDNAATSGTNKRFRRRAS